MDCIQNRKRGPEWKQSWADQMLSSFSVPPLQLMAIFAIVVFLLSFSQYNSYKEQMHYTFLGFRIFLFLVPVLLVVLMQLGILSGDAWWLGWRSSSQHGWQLRREPTLGAAGFPWCVAALLGVVVALVAYQSSFQSKWVSFRSSN